MNTEKKPYPRRISHGELIAACAMKFVPAEIRKDLDKQAELRKEVLIAQSIAEDHARATLNKIEAYPANPRNF